MRYRPFGNSGKAVSALSLLLRESAAIPTPATWRSRLYTALESGINCFEVIDGGPVVTAGLAASLPAVERGLLFLSWRIIGDQRRPLNAQNLSAIIRNVLKTSGAGYLDLLMFDETAFATLTPDGMVMLQDIRAAGLVLQLGLVGDGSAVELVIADPAFEVLATPFSLVSDWRTRRLVKDSANANMTAIAYDALPADLLKPPPPAQKPSLLHRGRPEPLAGAGAYGFLHQTQGWAPDELCIAYALTEPAFATIQLDVASGVDVERLAAVAERDMPTGAAAQIEMARFSVDPSAQQKRA